VIAVGLLVPSRFSDTGPKKVQLPLGAAARTLQITILPDSQQRRRR
jgi:hypothetical protein